MRIAFFTEGGYEGRVSRDNPNMRTDLAWICSLQADHYNISRLPQIKSNEYDLGIVILPKLNIDKISQYPLIKEMKRVCKKIGTMQEGPHWYFQDYPMEHQLWFVNTLRELDFILCHNSWDKDYYRGLVGHKRVYQMKSLMITDNIKPQIEPKDRSGVIIGGNMCQWYGGFDSYIVAQEFEEQIYAPSMGRKVQREEEMDIDHLPYMDWLNWMNNLSKFKYGVHLMRTHAAGTFALNCAYHGIPCIGYKGLDTQSLCHPQLTVEVRDLVGAKKLAKKLVEDSNFYETACVTARRNFDVFFGEEEFLNVMNKTFKEILNEGN